jgi:Arc/MetJ-type ribon-helix-helix transcriptional regulator
MTVHLPPWLENPLLAAVHNGRYASLDEAMAEAASLLLERLEQDRSQPSEKANQAQDGPAHKPIWDVVDDLR